MGLKRVESRCGENKVGRSVLSRGVRLNKLLQAIEAMDAPGNFLNVKLIPEFDGSSHIVAEWLRKAESACQLCGITDVARAIGLRLTGAAFEVFDQMAPEERGNLEKVKERLLAAFAPDPFMAFREFKARRLRDGEIPDGFLAGLRRLALLAGGVSARVLASAFIDGLPERTQEMVRSGTRVETLSLDELLARARAMLAAEPSSSDVKPELAAGVSITAPAPGSPTSDWRCYACGGVNHFARECPTRHRDRGATVGRTQKQNRKASQMSGNV
uniref:CCHC-type domain-containing protein n=1 Tax=Trichuris muris TaxID=70415 RepID=A0A5S6QC95_TRIMR